MVHGYLRMPNSELQRINSFLTAFARRQAGRIVDLPGGFAVYDDAFAHSRANTRSTSIWTRQLAQPRSRT